MTNQELEAKLTSLVREERRITNEILRLMNLAEDRGLHLDLGFSSLFDWLTRGFKYSNAAAHRRTEAAKLIRAVPEVMEKMESGDINLTDAAKVSGAIKAQEKATGQRLTAEQKAEAVSYIEEKTGIEVDQALFELFPETVQAAPREQKVAVGPELVSVTMNLTAEDIENLEWAKNFLSHSVPGGAMGEVTGRILKEFRLRNDRMAKASSKRNEQATDERSMTQNASAAEAKRVNKKPSQGAVRRIVFQEAGGCCEYVDEVTGRRCTSKFQLQIDHIQPRAAGGSDDRENFRVLCRAHNLRAAETELGTECANAWRRASTH